jgi:hypothetical protein
MDNLNNICGKLPFPVKISNVKFDYTKATSIIDPKKIGNIFVCRINPNQHVFSITPSEQEKIIKEMKKNKNKHTGRIIEFKSKNGKKICEFENMLTPKSVDYFDENENKFPCLFCLDNKNKKYPIEKITNCISVINAYNKERKRNKIENNNLKNKELEKKKEKRKSEDNNTKKIEREPKYNLKDIELKKEICNEIICIKSIENKCYDYNKMPKIHNELQNKLTDAYFKGIIKPLENFKSNNYVFDFLDEMMRNIKILYNLNIKNDKNENIMILLNEDILLKKIDFLINKKKINKIKKLKKKMISNLEGVIKDVENYLNKNTIKNINISIDNILIDNTANLENLNINKKEISNNLQVKKKELTNLDKKEISNNLPIKNYWDNKKINYQKLNLDEEFDDNEILIPSLLNKRQNSFEIGKDKIIENSDNDSCDTLTPEENLNSSQSTISNFEDFKCENCSILKNQKNNLLKEIDKKNQIIENLKEIKINFTALQRRQCLIKKELKEKNIIIKKKDETIHSLTKLLNKLIET